MYVFIWKGVASCFKWIFTGQKVNLPALSSITVFNSVVSISYFLYYIGEYVILVIIHSVEVWLIIFDIQCLCLRIIIFSLYHVSVTLIIIYHDIITCYHMTSSRFRVLIFGHRAQIWLISEILQYMYQIKYDKKPI